MPAYLLRSLQVLLDLLTLSVAYWLAYLFRFEFSIPPMWVLMAVLGWPCVVVFQYMLLSAFGVPRLSWRYVSTGDTMRIAIATGTATALLIASRLLLELIDDSVVIPIGVLCMGGVLMFVGLVGIRTTRRLYGEARERKLRSTGKQRTRVLLIGAGQAGVLVSREILSRPDLGLQAVGFLDDDPFKLGMRIAGLKVLGRTEDLADIVEHKRVERVLITIANARGPEIRRIAMLCQQVGIDTKIIPGIYEIVGERVNLSRIREVAIEDLLGRQQVQLDEPEIRRAIHGAVVMVTGAGGSIGSELCRQAARYQPAALVLVERFENALFEIHRELIALHPEIQIEPRIGDVTDQRCMERIFDERRPSLVFHAAAHKHVPMMELNPGEAVKNNVGGTRTIADLANRFGVDRFVLVSTDKAVNPTSVMGATKRVAELYTQALGQGSKTRYVTVRFGNVLGSNGSVIPIFKQQIAAGGPVTITHPDMRRYFMTIPEASQLVLQASAMGQGGEIFILDMGEPVRIVDLARDLITLSGFKPDDDIEIKFSGLRPGEKLFEELATSAEHADKTKHPKIFIGHVPGASFVEVAHTVEEMLTRVDVVDADTIRGVLGRMVPEYSNGSKSRVSPPERFSNEHGPTDARPMADSKRAGSVDAA